MTVRYRLDPVRSRFTVQAFATGLLSFLAHSPTFGVRDFAGEMSFLTGAPTTAAVHVVEPVRFVAWTTGELERFLTKHPSLRAALQLVIGRDLAAKLREGGGRTWDAAPKS